MIPDSTAVISEERAINTTERVALVVYHLLEGAELTTAEVQEMAGLKNWEGAERMLDKASRVVPITKFDSKWKRF